MKRIISLALCACIALSMNIPAAAADSDRIEKTVAALGIITCDDNGDMNLSRYVTRAQFAKMLVSASAYKDSAQQGSGSSPFKDVKYSHWAADYIVTAIENKWMTGYLDGTFHPDSTITLEEAASAILKLLGYTADDLTGTYPNAYISKFNSLKLGKGLALAQGQILTRNDCMYIFYNLMNTQTKNGTLYGAALGYEMDTNGEIDFDALVNADLEGPFVMTGAGLSTLLPFNPAQADIYRNSKPAAAGEISRYDVVYYNTTTKTVWAYSSRVIGILTAVAPSTIAPSAVTVAGNTYALGTASAKNKVSATGRFAVGDTVALLIGMDGSVADIIPASEIDDFYCGVVTSAELYTYSTGASAGNAVYTITVACTDGVSRQCVVDGIERYSAGNVVSVNLIKGEVSVKKHSSRSLPGTFNSAGTMIGEYTLSDAVEIMDVSKDGSWMLLYPSRLAGVKLESGMVGYYELDSKGRITHLILNDVTGDMQFYGILTSVSETQTEVEGKSELDPSIKIYTTVNSGNYQYLLNGSAGKTSTSDKLYQVEQGPAIFYYTDGQISDIKNLESIAIDTLSETAVFGGGSKYKISDKVQVFIRSGSGNNYRYDATSLSAVNTDEYSLTGYFENIFAAGGQIRMLIAVKK